MHFVQLWWLSQVVGPGFEPGLMLDFFVSQPVGRGFEPLAILFASVSRKMSRCLAGILFENKTSEGGEVTLSANASTYDQPLRRVC